MTLLANHPERSVIRLLLKQNAILKHLEDEDRLQLARHLKIFDGGKGDFLLHQSVREMEQYSSSTASSSAWSPTRKARR
jgi:hypothetical protein